MKLTEKLQSLKERFTNSVGITYKMNAAELAIFDVIEKIISDEDSQFFVPDKGMFYIINKEKHYFMKLYYGRIYIVNSNDSIIKDCNLRYSEELKKMIYKHIDDRVYKLNEAIFNNEITLLHHVTNKFDSTKDK